MKQARKKIPESIDSQVMYFADRRCCVDQKSGDHIHHLDGNAGNNKFENLVLLCFDCHDNASIVGSLKKKLSAKTILKYREHHYAVIRNQREASLNKFDHPVQQLSSEILIESSKTAIILVEIAKLKGEYFNAIDDKRNEILERFHSFEELKNVRISYEIISFLVRISYGIWNYKQNKYVDLLYFLTIDYLRINPDSGTKKEKTQLCEEAIRIAFNICYDGFFHLNDFKTVQWGLLLFKNIYRYAFYEKLLSIKTNVFEKLKLLAINLDERNYKDIKSAKQFIQIYEADLETVSLSFTPLPKNLEKLVNHF